MGAPCPARPLRRSPDTSLTQHKTARPGGTGLPRVGRGPGVPAVSAIADQPRVAAFAAITTGTADGGGDAACPTISAASEQPGLPAGASVSTVSGNAETAPAACAAGTAGTVKHTAVAPRTARPAVEAGNAAITPGSAVAPEQDGPAGATGATLVVTDAAVSAGAT